MKLCIMLAPLLAVTCGSVHAAVAQAEALDRGVVAVGLPGGEKGVFVSWRSLDADAEGLPFDVYRDGVKVNDRPLDGATCYTDSAGRPGALYRVVAGAGCGVAPSGECTAWEMPCLRVPVDRPEAGCTGPRGQLPQVYEYRPDDMSIGDVDGDGQMELFLKWSPSNSRDSAHKGFTGPVIIDCYRMDGTRLWRVNLGHNIRAGQHYTQFLVYDFDGDGRAEMICKTAPGTLDGRGVPVLLPGDKVTDDYRMHTDEPAKILGHVRGGAEYLTCFDGLTGANLSTIPYRPGYAWVDEQLWGDDHCNRSDRYQAAVAFLDGEHPSALMCRGYYTCAFVWAVDYRGGRLQERWLHQSVTPWQGLWDEGAHSVSVGDVDGDGCDELIYGAAALDHDGTLLYRTGAGHGDALHLAPMIPGRPGLQVYMPHENTSEHFHYDTTLRDAATGEILYSRPQTGFDVGRGLAADITDRYPGYEYWSIAGHGIYNQGREVGRLRMPVNFRIYWDGDLLDELLDGTSVTKPAADLSRLDRLVDFRSLCPGAHSCNGTKKTPCLQADLLGDWREEVVLYDGDTCSDLLVFTTAIPTAYRIPCLLLDHNYRMAVAWQNSTYNQPPHTGYSLPARYGR